MNSQALLVFAVVALAVFQMSGRVKADRPPTEEEGHQWGETVNGLRAHIEISDDAATRPYHPGEPLQFAGCIQNDSAKSVQIAGLYEEMNAHTLLYVRVPDGKVLVRRSFGYPERNQSGLILPQGDEFTFRFDGRIDARFKGWFVPHTLESETKLSFRQPGTYRFWFEYNVSDGDQASWSGKLESNHVALTIIDLPPAQRLQKPTAAQLDQLRVYLGSKGKYPYPGRTELVKAMNRTENEGLAVYLVGQLDQDPADGEQIFYLLRQRASGIDGPYLHQFADWCIGFLKHGTVDQASFFGFEGSPIEAPLEYLHFHPDDAKLRDRIVAVAEQCLKISRLPDGGRKQPGAGNNEPSTSEVSQFFVVGGAVEILFDLKVLHDGMGVDGAVTILGRPAEQDSTRITWILPTGGVRLPRISADVKDGKLSNFH